MRNNLITSSKYGNDVLCGGNGKFVEDKND